MKIRAFRCDENAPATPGQMQPYIGADGLVRGYRYFCAGCGRESWLGIRDSSGRGWTPEGDPTDIENLTLSPSIYHNPELGGCGWHGWLKNGEFQQI